ncbi:MAG: sugar transferase [Patescibacteria group bacterium]
MVPIILKVKRSIDIVLSLIGLVVLSPLFLLIAFLIKLDSEGPVFAKLKRISQGKEFNFYKFRSMVKEAHLLKADLAVFNNRKDTPFFKMKDDPRITRAGRFLRRYYLDELPSLFSVLKGEISLVGPRPHEPEEVVLYRDKYPEVVAAKAGITCLPRLYNPHITFEEEMVFEEQYLKNQSLLLDFKILVKTLAKVLKDRPEG